MPPFNRRVLEVAIGVWLLVDLQRVWAPSLITIFGRAASTPAEWMGLFALAVVASPALLLLVVRRTPAHRRPAQAGWCLLVALLSRVVVHVAEGGTLQLWAATVGVAFALAWLCLSTRHPGPDLLAGVFTGVATATTVHAALGTWGAVWRDDAWGWTTLVVQAGVVGWVVVRQRSDASGSPATAGASPMLAFWLMPALLLAGVVVANVARASAGAGAPGAAVVAAAAVLAAGVSLLLARLPWPVTLVDALLVVGATWWVLTADPGWGSAVAAAVGLVALAGVLLTFAGPAVRLAGATGGQEHDADGVRRRDPMWAAWAGGLAWVVLFFAYYAGYDLGYRADWLLVVLAIALGITATWSRLRLRAAGETTADTPADTRAEAEPDPDRERTGSTAAATRRPAARARATRPHAPRVAVVLLVTAAVAFGCAWAGPSVTVRPVASTQVERPDGLTVMAWNLRMGYGIDGRFRVREVAELIAEEDPDVVLLSEVDRGWLLNGGQDQLEILARLLDMEAHFGAAADPVWGDAILTDLPVRDLVTHPLPDFGAVTGAQVMAATVTKGTHDYDVISTHLQPSGHGPGQGSLLQAQRIAEFVEGRIDPGRPLVLGGDFNVRPATESWQALLDAGVDDGLAESRPLFTSPADGPEEQIDHLFVSHGTWVQQAWAVSTQLSDHFPVLITVSPRGPATPAA